MEHHVENIEVTEEMKQEEMELLDEKEQKSEETFDWMEEEKSNITYMPETKENANENYTHTFAKPITILGKKYKTMTFYFNTLTGEDIEAVEQELQDQGKYVLSPEISSTFQSALAARAARIGSDEIRRLPVVDYMKIKNKTRNFLANMG